MLTIPVHDACCGIHGTPCELLETPKMKQTYEFGFGGVLRILMCYVVIYHYAIILLVLSYYT